MSSSSSSSGIGFCGMLAVLFIGLKLTNFIDWSWLWVLSPLWLWIPIILGIVFVGLIIYLSYVGIRFLLKKLEWI